MKGRGETVTEPVCQAEPGVYTDVHRHILDITREKFGTTPFAIIGRRSLGENAEVKYGTTWTTDAYFRKLDRHLNSIPWDEMD